MASNIVVTMLNKATFAVVDFKYPYALSSVHMACNIIGTQLYFYSSRYAYVICYLHRLCLEIVMTL
jgi:hypothetical protein